MSGLAFSQALTAGQDAVTLDYTALGLSSPPSAVRVVGISKTVSGQANLYASILEGWSATTASVELNAPCDVSGRKIQFLVIP